LEPFFRFRPGGPSRAVNAAPDRYLIGTLIFRFSPKFGLLPVSLALASSKAAKIELDGPSDSSAVLGSNRNTRTFGSSGPPGHHG
jgi:hypothetical protein